MPLPTVSVLVEAEKVTAWLYQPLESAGGLAVTFTCGFTVSLVYAADLSVEGSSYGAWLVAFALKLSEPSERPLRSSPFKLTVPTPAVAAVDAVTSWAGVPSETVRCTVSGDSEGPGSATSTFAVALFLLLMYPLPTPRPFLCVHEGGASGATVTL